MGLIDTLESIMPATRLDIFGKDSLMHSSLPYYTLSVLAFSRLVIPDLNPFVILIIIYVLLPLLDQVFSLDERSPTHAERIELQRNDFWFRVALYIEMVIDWTVFIKTLSLIAQLELKLNNLLETAVLLFLISNLQAIQFMVAHEVMHKPGKFYRALGTLHMVKLGYTHFTYHHLYNHHFDVSTPVDPSSAKQGQSLYPFFIRCVRDSWISVYRRTQADGKKWYQNMAVLSIISNALLFSSIYYFWGLKTVILYGLITLGAIFYLQATNYMEHYGLRRKLLANGTYQKVTIRHSWNAPHRFSNYLTFKLQRHSDHHENSSKPYQALATIDQSPTLPHGYTLMIIMSFFPSIWRQVMDPLVEAYMNTEGKIDPSLNAKAVKETRKFYIKLSMGVFIIYFLSQALSQ